MKTIKVFLASSEELEDDRIKFGNLIRKLNVIYEKRGIQIKLFEWEDFDAAYNGISKQEEYNEQICDSDIFLALFHIKAGKYTIEEFNYATEEFKKHTSPKIYTYIKQLGKGEVESPELKSFKECLLKDLGHYWCNYNNTDTMHLHFVMQLQLLESKPSVNVKIQNNNLLLDETPIANLDNVPFVSLNREYQNIKSEIEELDDDLVDLRERLVNDHDNIQLRNKLHRKSERREELSKRIEQNQQYLYETAMKFTRIQGEKCNARVYQAKMLLDEGKAAEANAILDMKDIVRDAKLNIQGYRKAKEQEQAWQDNIIHSINEFLLKASTIMVDDSISDMSERCNQACKAYKEAIELAEVIHYDKVDIILYNYACLLQDFNRMSESIAVFKQIVSILRDRANQDTTFYPLLAIALKDTADVHANLNHFEEAEKAYQDSLDIRRKLVESGCEDDLNDYYHTLTNMAFFHFSIHKYKDSEKEYDEASAILDKLYKQYGNKYITDIAEIMVNWALLHIDLHQYEKAERNLKESLKIFQNLKDVNEEYRMSNIATSYENLALMYEDMRKLDESENANKEALAILRKLYVVNKEVYLPHLIVPMQNLANTLSMQGKYDEAEKEMQEVLRIRIFLSDNNDGAFLPEIADCYENLGVLYNDTRRFKGAEDYHKRALKIYEGLLTKDNKFFFGKMADVYDNLNITYKDQGRYDEAEIMLNKALSIYNELALDNKEAYLTWIARTKGNFSSLYVVSRRAEKAEIFAKEALKLDNSQTWIYTNLLTSYILQNKVDESIQLLPYVEQLDPYFMKEYIEELVKFQEQKYFSQEQIPLLEKIKGELKSKLK
jgi:tetratricopeptide (TPR) repeat protein